CPENYDEVHREMSREGARVLALGYKEIGHLSHQQVREISRGALECDLQFAGFMVVSCPLKNDSKAVIQEIQEASHHVIKPVMLILHIYSNEELHFIQKEHTLILQPSPNQGTRQWHWESIDGTVSVALPPPSVSSFVHQFDLCVTGEGLARLACDPHLLHTLLPHIQVFARVSPKQKGHPFMESLSENRPLLWSIAISGLAIVGLLTGSSPEFNEQFALVDIPTEVRSKKRVLSFKAADSAEWRVTDFVVYANVPSTVQSSKRSSSPIPDLTPPLKSSRTDSPSPTTQTPDPGEEQPESVKQKMEPEITVRSIDRSDQDKSWRRATITRRSRIALPNPYESKRPIPPHIFIPTVKHMFSFLQD
ncbi:hypothetical protein XENOCAPTIV_019073, partial [Xenoophorus captivus]